MHCRGMLYELRHTQPSTRAYIIKHILQFVVEPMAVTERSPNLQSLRPYGLNRPTTCASCTEMTTQVVALSTTQLRKIFGEVTIQGDTGLILETNDRLISRNGRLPYHKWAICFTCLNRTLLGMPCRTIERRKRLWEAFCHRVSFINPCVPRQTLSRAQFYTVWRIWSAFQLSYETMRLDDQVKVRSDTLSQDSSVSLSQG